MTRFLFGDLFCFIRNGMNVKQDKSGEGLPISRIETIADASIDPNRVGNAGLLEDECKDWLLESGDILFSHINSVEHVGKCAVYRGVPQKLVHGMNLLCLRPDANRIVPEFAKYLIRGSVFRSHLSSYINKAVNQASVSIGNLKTISVEVPTLSEQRRIAAILDRADALRAKRRAALARLDELTQAIFDNLLSQGGTKWPEVSLPDAFWFQEGPGVRKWQFTTEGVKLLNVGNIEKTGVLNLEKTDRHLSAAEANGKYKHFLVDDGDLVIASSGITFDQDGLLRTRGAFVKAEHLPLCMNTSTIRFKDTKDVSDLRFLWIWLGSREFRTQITKLVTGSAQQNFGPSHLSRLKITLPPLSVQRIFAEKIARVDSVKLSHCDSLCNMDALFASLQDRAFRGVL